MNSEENKKLDRLMQDLYKEIEIPDSTPSWNDIQGRLNRRKHRKHFSRRIKLASGFVCVSLVFSILISGGNIQQRAYAHFSDFFNEVIQIFLRKPADDPNSALTIPPPAFEEGHSEVGNTGIVQPEKVTLEEAKQKLAFPLLLTSYVPERLELKSIQIFKDTDGQYRAVYLEYVNSAGMLVKVNQRLITDNSSIMTEVREGAGTIKDVIIREQYPGILLELSDGTIFIEWIASDVKILLSGPLIETEAMKWAGSFQP